MGLFSRMFQKKPVLPPADLSLIGCDIHSHFIPAIDDGSKSVEDSIAMIKALHELGYKKFITSPHIMSDYYRNTPEIILNGLTKVREALVKEQIPVTIDAIAEYYFDFDFEQKIGKEPLLTFGKNYLLFEISYVTPPENLHHVVFKMQTNGYTPVLAHPERYNYWHGQFDKYEQIKDWGVLLQLNLNSLTGHYSESTKVIAKRMIDEDMIDLVGTDCHHIGHVNLLSSILTDEHLHKLIAKPNLINKLV